MGGIRVLARCVPRGVRGLDKLGSVVCEKSVWRFLGGNREAGSMLLVCGVNHLR